MDLFFLKYKIAIFILQDFLLFRYVLTLMVDGMRAVKRFHFDKAAASVLTTSVCIVYLAHLA